MSSQGEQELETTAAASASSFEVAMASMLIADGGALSAFTVGDVRPFLPALKQMYRYGWNQGQQRLHQAEELLRWVRALPESGSVMSTYVLLREIEAFLSPEKQEDTNE